MTLKYFTLVLFLLFIPLTVFSQEVQQSHIKGNLPETFEEFQFILERDLESYFSTKYGKPVTVKYELLRRSATQSGVAYPKFYAWIDIYNSENRINSGAVRVAAIEKVRIKVTNFISRKDIIKNPKSIESIFPMALCDGIRNRVGIVE